MRPLVACCLVLIGLAFVDVVVSRCAGGCVGGRVGGLLAGCLAWGFWLVGWAVYRDIGQALL